MRRGIILIFVFIIGINLFGVEKRISDIKTLDFEVVEISSTNSSKKEIRYSINMEIPDRIKKTVNYPEMNKGETYIYVGNKKNVYIPVFNQIVNEDVTEEENIIVKTVNLIFRLEKNDEQFRKEYYDKKISSMVIEKDSEITIKDYLIYEGYLLPKDVDIYYKKDKVASVSLSISSANREYDSKEFEFKK